MDIEELIRAVIQCIYNVRGVLAPGFMEMCIKMLC